MKSPSTSKYILNSLCILFIGMSCQSVNAAKPKIIECQITSVDGSYKGKCLFLAEKGGSFTLQNTRLNQPLINDTTDLNVSIIEKGIAEVRGLRKGGTNSRWGEAERSQTQKACWIGSDFKVCAW